MPKLRKKTGTGPGRGEVVGRLWLTKRTNECNGAHLQRSKTQTDNMYVYLQSVLARSNVFGPKMLGASASGTSCINQTEDLDQAECILV